MIEKKLLKIGDLARASGLSERSLRQYEDLGIISPQRTEGGTRSYSDQDVSVAQLVQKMRDLNISVNLISDIATTRRQFSSGAESSKAIRSLLSELSGDLMEMTRLATEMQGEVVKVIMSVDECLNCKNHPSKTGCPTCPMNRAAGNSPLADMIWRDPEG